MHSGVDWLSQLAVSEVDKKNRKETQKRAVIPSRITIPCTATYVSFRLVQISRGAKS